MLNRGQIKTNVKINLNDAGILSTFFSDAELNASLQDGYNEIVCKSRCNVKKVTLNWPDATVYYDFVNGGFGVSDYLGTTAILNNNTNLYLSDNISLRDLDRIRRDWELWTGNAQYWVSHSLQYIAIVPSLVVGVGTFNLIYWATAPVFVTDADTPIIASDMQILLELYTTEDMLETAEEPSKGLTFQQMYDKKLAEYTERCQNLAMADVLLRI